MDVNKQIIDKKQVFLAMQTSDFFKVWKGVCSKCYSIKNQIDPFRIHPLPATP